MKNVKPFAFTSANKNAVKNNKKWQANDKAATAGCSGPWAYGHSRWGSDSGIMC